MDKFLRTRTENLGNLLKTAQYVTEVGFPRNMCRLCDIVLVSVRTANCMTHQIKSIVTCVPTTTLTL